MRHCFLALFLVFGLAVQAQVDENEVNADSVSWLMNTYADSLQIYRQRLDSLQQENSSLRKHKASPVDMSRLFLPLTFYQNIAHRQFDLSGYGDETSTPFISPVDNVLLNVYLNRPDLVADVAAPDDGTQPVIEATPVIIDANPQVAEQVAPVVEQTDVAPVTVMVKKPNFWSYVGNFNLHINQNYISGNWYQGGESNYSMIGTMTLEANYNNKQKVKWNNKLETRLGMATSKGDTLHSRKMTENLIRLTSNLGIQASKKWYYALEVEAYTQMLKDYKVNNASYYTDIFAPLNLKVSLGMDYDIDWFKHKLTGKIHLAPLAYNMKYCSRTHLAPQYGIEEGKHFFDDYGSLFTVNTTWNFASNVYWRLRLAGYTSYKRAELEIENTFHFQINKYISTDIFIYPRFDDSHKRDEHHAYWQFKEYMSFGFSYNF